jgi:MFS family permease
MNKILLGILAGGILGIFDGLTAWFTPEARSQMAGIVVGSTIKGLIAGVLIGWFARKVNSLFWGIVFGTGVGMILAFLVAYMGQQGYYFEIVLPGSIVGLIVGYATQKYGSGPASKASRAA